MKDKKIQLIDVRTPSEFASGHIEGAKNIDFTVIPDGFNFVIPKGSDFKFKENK